MGRLFVILSVEFWCRLRFRDWDFELYLKKKTLWRGAQRGLTLSVIERRPRVDLSCLTWTRLRVAPSHSRRRVGADGHVPVALGGPQWRRSLDNTGSQDLRRLARLPHPNPGGLAPQARRGAGEEGWVGGPESPLPASLATWRGAEPASHAEPSHLSGRGAATLVPETGREAGVDYGAGLPRGDGAGRDLTPQAKQGPEKRLRTWPGCTWTRRGRAPRWWARRFSWKGPRRRRTARVPRGGRAGRRRKGRPRSEEAGVQGRRGETTYRTSSA